jgi:amino acid permease
MTMKNTMMSLVHNLPFALYCAAIIVGAGVLSLPLLAHIKGFVPLLLIVVLMAVAMIYLYTRIVDNIHRLLNSVVTEKANKLTGPLVKGVGVAPNKNLIFAAQVSRGAQILDLLVRRVGIGSAGLWTLFIGMLFYVLPADIGYITIGGKSENAISQYAAAQGYSWGPFFLVGTILALLGVYLPKLVRKSSAGVQTIRKFCVMGSCWCLGVAVLGFAHELNLIQAHSTLETAVSSGLFLFSILASMLTGRTQIEQINKSQGLTPQHRVNVVVMSIEMLILVLAGISIAWLFFAADAAQPFYAFAPGWLSFEGLPRIIGVVLFALVGTGLFNLCAYPQLFESGQGTKGIPRFVGVVRLGTLVPLAIYVLWTLVSAISLSPAELAQGDKDNLITTILIAAKAARINPQFAPIIALTGYVFALCAVTTACHGFTESLADRVVISLKGRNLPLPPLLLTSYFWQVFILVVATTLAFGKDLISIGIDLSAILSFAGLAGGGLLIIILPLFFPYPLNNRARIRYAEVALIMGVVFVLAWCIVDEPTQGVLTWIKWTSASIVVAMTIWLMFSEPPEPTAGNQQEDKPQPIRQQLSNNDKKSTTRVRPHLPVSMDNVTIQLE